MNDPENKLIAMKPAPPSEDFERRMAALFEASRPRPALWRRNIAAWQALAACLFCTMAGFGASSYLRQPAPIAEPEIRTELHMIPTDSGPIRRAFDFTATPAYRSAESPPVQVIIQAELEEQRS